MKSSVRGLGVVGLLAAIVGLPARAPALCTDTVSVCAARNKAEMQCPCASATNHGQYVRCVAGVAKGEVAALRLPRNCKSSVIRCAARSTCGKPGFVTCCRTDSAGKTHCSIRRDATRCRLPATIGTKPSCCDACGPNPCPTTTTSTTSTTSTVVTTTTTSITTTTLCGNNMLDPGEECDGTNLGGAACSSPGGGFLPTCTGNCTIDCSSCPGGTCSQACPAIVPGQPIANTYQLLGVPGPKVCITSSATNALGFCNSDTDCGGQSGTCLQTPWATADGFSFPFPTGIQTTFTVAAADPPPTCSHTACIKCGNPNAACTGIPGCGSPPGAPQNGCSRNTCCDTPGFIVPTFNVPILGGLCGRVDQFACGLGVVNTSRPQTGDNEVIKAGDTSDPGPDCTYGTGDDCSSPVCKPCTVTGQGGDTKGKVVRSVGNSSPDTAGIHFRISTPELATVWQDSQNPCPQGSTFDSGEGLVSQLVLNAEPSTAGATASFADLNGDGCSRAGFGFKTGGDPTTGGPVTVGPPVARPQSYDGSVGSIQVTAGPIFSGSAPLNDVGFVAITPNNPATIAPADTCTCVPVAGCPE